MFVSYLEPNRSTKPAMAGPVEIDQEKPGPHGPGSRNRVADEEERKASGNGPDPGAHQTDTVEIGLFPGVLFSPLARLIALVQQFDLLQFVEGFAQQAFCVFQLNTQFVGGTGQILPPLDRSLGIGRIGEMRGIVDPGALLLGLDFALQIDRHALEVGDHTFNLGDPSALLVDLKLLQAD